MDTKSEKKLKEYKRIHPEDQAGCDVYVISCTYSGIVEIHWHLQLHPHIHCILQLKLHGQDAIYLHVHEYENLQMLLVQSFFRVYMHAYI